jgi:hypothetical protein
MVACALVNSSEAIPAGIWRRIREFLQTALVIVLPPFIALAGSSGRALTQEIQPISVYSALRDGLASDPASFATVFLRATPIDLLRAYGSDAQSFQNAWSDVENGAIAPNWISLLQPGGVASLYTKLLSNATWGRVPFTVEGQEFDDLVTALYTSENGKYVPKIPAKRLFAQQAELNAALQDWNATPPAQRTEQQKARLDMARSILANDKASQALIPKVARLKVLANYDYAVRGAQIKQRYLANIDAVSNRPRSRTAPTLNAFLSNAAWTLVSFALSPQATAAGGTYTPQLTPVWCCDLPSDIVTENLSHPIQVTFQLLRLAIVQPWRDDQILSGAARQIWKFRENQPSLSRGKEFLNTNDDTVDMTLLPKEIILIRNVQLKGSFDSKLLKALSDAVASQEKQVYFGPLAIAGDFQFGGQVVHVQPMGLDSQVLYIPGVQIFAYSSDVLPIVPDARSNLTWDSPLPALEGLEN